MAGEGPIAYGSWPSRIGSRLLALDGARCQELRVHGQDLYWLERRPAEQGRQALVRWRGGRREDVLPAGMGARTTVHEYGGGAYAVRNGVIWFSAQGSNQLFRLEAGRDPVLLGGGGPLRYADFEPDGLGRRLYCVEEDHRQCDLECRNSLVLLDATQAAEPTAVARGHDFYSSPRLSPDGASLLWLAWDYPQMPWDGTQLWCARLGPDGLPEEPQLVAGSRHESVFDPQWTAAGSIRFASDRTGFWNLYEWDGGEARNLTPAEADFGDVQWVFGLTTHVTLPGGRFATLWCEKGIWRLGVGQPDRPLTPVPLPYPELAYIAARGEEVFCVGSAPALPTAVVRVDTGRGEWQAIDELEPLPVTPELLSGPEPLDFATTGGAVAHGFYYPPRNPDVSPPRGALPPLLVNAHGGPTSQPSLGFQSDIQFFTSRGFGFVDVAYRGSSGYGRQFREALKGAWGVADVDDCIAAARHLVAAGRVDPGRLAIRGGSAGGYTTLAALAFRDYFQAGASYYGIADAEQAREDSHKFESRYDSQLYGAPEFLRSRSPIHQADRIRAGLILLQGLEDTIVLPNQADLMAAALRRNRVPFAYLAFPGEGHGFRQAANLIRAGEAELYFYSRLFGFELADPVEPVEIENLPPG